MHSYSADNPATRLYSYADYIAIDCLSAAVLHVVMNQSNILNILLCGSATLSLVSISLLMASSFYFWLVINQQEEQLVLLTNQQNAFSDAVATKLKQDGTVSGYLANYVA